ncbi:MAG: formyl transferase [Polyangiaceae bacterium]|nr:formyl transferase [Polyangiaceae bacterium]
MTDEAPPGAKGQGRSVTDEAPAGVKERRRVVLLAVEGPPTNVVFHALERAFGPVEVVIEEKVPRWQLVRGRYRRLGLWPVLGQLAFLGAVQPALVRRSRARVREILAEAGLDEGPIDPARVQRVGSVNTPEARDRLRRLAPTVVVLNGTRIVGRETLRCVQAPFLNMHAGITPRYRGVHGGYWALVEGRPDLVGTTVHLVDEGIDTGRVVEQTFFRPGPRDSFATYPSLHLAAGLPALVRAVRRALEGTLETVPGPDEPSRLRYHPTAWGYLRARVR